MNSGNFKTGHKPWNLGVKGIHLNPDTEFKKGEMVGKDHYSWKGGEQINKNDCAYLSVGANQRVRRPKKLYEDANGEVPKGWIIYHLDGDKDNDHLDNLIAIPRAILVRINSNRINANYHEIKEAVEQFKNK
jgi:hypothetical protein